MVVAVLVVALGLAFQLTGSDAGTSPTCAFEIDDGNIVDGSRGPLDWGSLFGRSPAGGATAPVVVKNARRPHGRLVRRGPAEQRRPARRPPATPARTAT